MNIDEKNSELRIVWYRAIPLRHFGGLQRLLVEGIRCFREMGANVTLVLNEPILPEFENFYNSCKPDILVLPGFFPVQTKPGPGLSGSIFSSGSDPDVKYYAHYRQTSLL